MNSGTPGELGWHPDPSGKHEVRFFDGVRWTEHVADAGVPAVDPIAPPPAPTILAPSAAQPTPVTSRRWWKKKRWWLAGAAVAVIGIAAATSGGGDDDTEPASAGVTTVVETVDATTVPPETTTSTTTSTTTTTEAPPPAPVVVEGSGDDVFDVPAELAGEPLIVRAVHTGRSNFIVASLALDGSRIGSLVNEIGAYDGTVPLGFEDGAAGLIEVQADGAWSFEFRHISLIERYTATVTGRGDHVVLLEGSGGVAVIAHDGTSNFAVRSIPLDGGFADLVVNEIGPYDGRRPLPAESVLEITADGNWSITFD